MKSKIKEAISHYLRGGIYWDGLYLELVQDSEGMIVVSVPQMKDAGTVETYRISLNKIKGYEEEDA